MIAEKFQRVAFAQSVLVACILGAFSTFTQPAVDAHAYTVTPNTNALLLMPELKTAPAPAWIKPGMRITIDKIDGTISPDPKKRGGGHGLEQLQVVAVLPDAVAVQDTSYLIAGLSNTLSLTGSQGLVTTPGNVNDVWITPGVFQKYMNLNGSGVSSTKQEYKAAGKTWNAAVQQVTSGNGTTVYYRDIESGVLLHTSSEVISGDDKIIAQSTLLGIREVKSPWTQGRLPRVLEGIHQLRYEGSQDHMVPGSPVFRTPMNLTMKVIGRGPDFIQLERTGEMTIGTVRSDMGKLEFVFGPSQITPIAVDPDDLAKVRQGQELDNDPVSKVIVRVSFVGIGQNGKNVVVISSGVPGDGQQQTDSIYDAATGLLVGTSSTNPPLNQITRTTFVGKD